MAIKIKEINYPELTFFEKMYFPQIFGGLWITLKHLLGFNPITVQYPEEVKELLKYYNMMKKALKRFKKGAFKSGMPKDLAKMMGGLR